MSNFSFTSFIDSISKDNSSCSILSVKTMFKLFKIDFVSSMLSVFNNQTFFIDPSDKNSVFFPWKITFPWLIIVTVSTNLLNSSNEWLEITIPTPFWDNSMSKSLNSFIPTGSSPLNGSSNNKIVGWWIKAWASPKRCFIPNEKLDTLQSTLLSKPTKCR